MTETATAQDIHEHVPDGHQDHRDAIDNRHDEPRDRRDDGVDGRADGRTYSTHDTRMKIIGDRYR
jgi:hypothetical protein